MKTGRKLLSVSSDGGKTYKKRWVSVNNFSTEHHELKVGDLIKLGGAIHKTVIKNGKIDCPLVKCADDEHDWENTTWHKQCRKCTFRVTWDLRNAINPTESPSTKGTAAEEDVYGNDCKGDCS